MLAFSRLNQIQEQNIRKAREEGIQFVSASELRETLKGATDRYSNTFLTLLIFSWNKCTVLIIIEMLSQGFPLSLSLYSIWCDCVSFPVFFSHSTRGEEEEEDDDDDASDFDDAEEDEDDEEDDDEDGEDDDETEEQEEDGPERLGSEAAPVRKGTEVPLVVCVCGKREERYAIEKNESVCVCVCIFGFGFLFKTRKLLFERSNCAAFSLTAFRFFAHRRSPCKWSACAAKSAWTQRCTQRRPTTRQIMAMHARNVVRAGASCSAEQLCTGQRRRSGF